MALWEPAYLERLADNERRVLTRLRSEPEDDRFVQPPSGGGGHGIVLVRVISRSGIGPDLMLSCKRLEMISGALTPVGDEFDVYVYQREVDSLTWSQVHPSIEVDEDIPIHYEHIQQQWYCLWRITGTCDWSSS